MSRRTLYSRFTIPQSWLINGRIGFFLAAAHDCDISGDLIGKAAAAAAGRATRWMTAVRPFGAAATSVRGPLWLLRPRARAPPVRVYASGHCESAIRDTENTSRTMMGFSRTGEVSRFQEITSPTAEGTHSALAEYHKWKKYFSNFWHYYLLQT